MEALYDGATARLIAPGSNDPEIIPIGIIWHVDAGDSPSLYTYFRDRSGGIESHMHFPKVGRPEQYRVFGREADANLKANSFVVDGKRYGFISCETQGLERGQWNANQLAEMKKFALWGRDHLGIPLQRCAGPFSPGHGYHVMWGAPGPWTPVAKSCPGPDRIEQFDNILIPWMRAVSTQPEGTNVTPAEIQAVADAVWAKMLGPSTASDCAQKARSAAEAWGDGGKRTRTLNEIAADVAAIKAKLNLS